jgi:hypothetical protein
MIAIIAHYKIMPFRNKQFTINTISTTGISHYCIACLACFLNNYLALRLRSVAAIGIGHLVTLTETLINTIFRYLQRLAI